MGFEFIDEDKELSGEADKVAESPEKAESTSVSPSEAPNSENQETEQKETSISYEVEDDGSVTYGKTKYKSMDDVFKSVDNLQALYGRQTTELGDLRKAKTEFDRVRDQQDMLNSQSTEEVSISDEDYDVYDPSSVKTFIKSEATNIAKNMFDGWVTDNQVKSSFKDTVLKLKEQNPAVTDEQWMDIARFGDENGIANIGHAFLILKHQNKVSEAKSEGRKEVLSELGKVADIPQSLSGTGGSTKTGKIDFDSLSVEDWGNLPEDVRKKALLEA